MDWNCMNWELFWTAFGAIGGTLGAIATTAAVIVTSLDKGTQPFVVCDR